MNDLLAGVKEAFNSRFGSTMYGTFILAWLTTNRKFWFISFFVDEKIILYKYSLLKNEYLVSLYHLFGCGFMSGLWTISKLLLIPAIVTYLAHWVFSKVETKVYKKGLSNKTERKIIKANEEKKYQKAVTEIEEQKSNILKIQKKNIEKEIEIKKQSKQIKTEEENRLIDYEKLFNNNKFMWAMKELNTAIYSNKGKIGEFDIRGDERRSYINKESLAILDTNGLINLDQKINNVSLTQKGKFFMKNFINRTM